MKGKREIDKTPIEWQQAEARRRHEIRILSEFSEFLTGDVDIETAVNAAINMLLDYLGGALCITVTTLDSGRRELVVRAARASPSGFCAEKVGERLDLADMEASLTVIETGEPLILADISDVDFFKERAVKLREAGLFAVLYVPLLAKSKPIGVLHIDVWEASRPFSAEEIMLCQGMANLLAAAIENGRLLAAERKQLRLAQTLQQVGALLTTKLSLPELYDHIFSLLADVVQYDAVSIQLIDKENWLYMAASRGHKDPQKVDEFLRILSDHALSRFSSGQLVRVIPDTEADAGWVPSENIKVARSWVGALLQVKGRPIGILNVDNYTVNAFDDETGETVAAFANQAAIAIENGRLHQEIQKRAAELSALHQIAVNTATSMDLDDLFSKATEVVTAYLYPDNFGFVLVNERSGSLYPHPSYHGVPEEMKVGPIPMDSSLTGYVVQTGKAMLLNDVSGVEHYYPRNEETCSEAAVPIEVDGEVIGVINVEAPYKDAFSPEDILFLTTLAGLMSVSVARTRFYRRLADHSEELAREVARQTVALKAERDRTTTILENAGESIFLLDRSGQIVYVNRALEMKSGYRRQELIGRSPDFLNPGFLPESLHRELWRVISQGRFWSGELTCTRKNGTSYDVAMTMAPVIEATGRHSSMVVVQSDITRLKEVERLKSEFVTNVTHELRTPLTNIKTYVTLAERGREEQTRRYFPILHREIDRMAQLMTDLLDLASLETEAPPEQVPPLNLRPLVQEFVDIFQAKAELKQIDLVFNVAADLPAAAAVEDRHVGQLLTNLLSNAIAYSPAGGRIVVSLDTAVSSFVTISISDTGYGIHPDDLPYVFDRFYRSATWSKSNVPGTGLGLAICQEIVRRYDGRIEVDSEPGAGTTFSVWLPLADAAGVTR
jgi:PAS domain S-box-containing protein